VTPDQPPTPPDSKQILYAAAVAAIEDRSAKDAAARQRAVSRTNTPRLLVMALVAAVGVILLALQPAWLAGPRTPPPEPAGIAAASLRLTLLRERQRVLDFERERGRLPATLAEAGSPLADIDYKPQDDGRFSLAARAGDSLIVLQSNDNVGAFLGGSIRTLARRGAR
jgi:hypothetical protein